MIRPWRSSSAALAVVVSLGAFVLGGSDTAAAGDMTIQVRNASWGADTHTVQAGDHVFIDNADGFRHTFSVEGTSIDAELPAWQGRRVAIDLEPGAYKLSCAVPGHEFMTAELVVR